MIEFLLNEFVQGFSFGLAFSFTFSLTRDWLREREREALFKDLAKKSRERHKALFEAQDNLIKEINCQGNPGPVK